MKNLRVSDVKVLSSSSISVSFSEILTENLSTSNVSIFSETINVPDPQVLGISIKNNEIIVDCTPLTNLATYYFIFKSTTKYPFISLNNDSKLLEDGIGNKYIFTGPLEDENIIKNFLLSFFKENIYNLYDDTTNISKYINSISMNLSKALYDIRQSKNENFLYFNVIDEQKNRGSGPFDRLNEESAYEIVRVGYTPTNTLATNYLNFDSFPYYPVSLKSEIAVENLILDTNNELGVFNLNDLILNLKNNYVLKINSIIFNNSINYNIEKYGYSIFNSKYSQDFAREYYLLNDNQIKLNDSFLNEIPLNTITSVTVNYLYKNDSIIINKNSLKIYKINYSVREELPPIINIFNLKNSPIVDDSGKIPTLGGLTITNPNSLNYNQHPAFIKEIPFNLQSLPSSPGQYSVDYSSGTVYVYGEDTKNDGTGAEPPLLTYKYEFSFKENQDYCYDENNFDLSALQYGNLLNNNANISFLYEKVLIPNVDYIANVHKESLNERINNNIAALNCIKVKNTPITNIFKIYNETTGEFYSLERWVGEKVYFKYYNAPNIKDKLQEKISFKEIINEKLFVNSKINLNSKKYIKILLNNNNIISLTEDGIAYSKNTSLKLSNKNIFLNEIWYDPEFDYNDNLLRLNNTGDYFVDYFNGVIYCLVLDNNIIDIGFANYKNKIIKLQFPHIITPLDIYYKIQQDIIKNKSISFLSFSDGEVTPDFIENNLELSLNNDINFPYQILYSNNQYNIGVFIDGNFVSGITNKISYIRGLFEYNDLKNNKNPINFANYCNYDNFNVSLNPIVKTTYQNVQYDGTNYFIILNDEKISYISPFINYDFSVIRINDNSQLYNNFEITDDRIKLILNNSSSGDSVRIDYSFSIKESYNNYATRIAIDYNKGDFFIDYTYLADELIISYEYGDNVIDFRKNKNIQKDTQYYVSYKVGALRDSLFKNFASLTNIDELNLFDLSLNRETYRDILLATLTSFAKGPTLNALYNIIKNISHINPNIKESGYFNWSLGSSFLVPQNIKSSENFEFLPAKYSNGVLINDKNQYISFSGSSNIRLEEGTFETWISPQWDGIDNNSNLKIKIKQNNNNINNDIVYVGLYSDNPLIIDGYINISKNNIIIGKPNINRDGIYIYYDKNIDNENYKWYIVVNDGYQNSNSSIYSISIISDGSIYDVKSITVPKPSFIKTITSKNSITLNIDNNGLPINDGINFVSDYSYYLFDYGKENIKNRISIYKDPYGYINFSVWDKYSFNYNIKHNISNWKKNELHHIAASWKINNLNSKDELHLFIDGFEVPNHIRYESNWLNNEYSNFETIDSEQIIVSNLKDILSSSDLITTYNSNIVKSIINFSSYNIFIGDTIFIDEVGFNQNGYIITEINGQFLKLNENMPLSLNNGRFSINRSEFLINSDINSSTNIILTRTPCELFNSDLYTFGNTQTNILCSNINFENNNIKPGFLIRIEQLNKIYKIISVNQSQIVIDKYLDPFTNYNFYIYSNNELEIPGIKAINPSYYINKNYLNNTLIISNNIFAKDLVFLRTLGLNSKKISYRHYVWGDNVESMIMTKLPAPISLNSVSIKKILLPRKNINSLNSTINLNSFNFSLNLNEFCSNSQNGRSLSFSLFGNNIDFSQPVTLTISGNTINGFITENIIFSDYESIFSQNFYLKVDSILLSGNILNLNKDFCSLEIKERYSITKPEFSDYYPVIKYNYEINSGNNLYFISVNEFRDENNNFNGSEIGNYLLITYPINIAGYYLINNISSDTKSLYISTLPQTPIQVSNFNNAKYKIIKKSEANGGFQNGYFSLEANLLAGQQYFLLKGFYDIEYYTDLYIKIDPINSDAYIGTDFNKNQQINSIIDQTKIYSIMLSDTRVGENISKNQLSITKDFNSIKKLTKDSNTLFLANFDLYPFKNEADYYINNFYSKYYQSNNYINDNFGNNIVLNQKPFIIENNGIINFNNEGTIEFWINSLIDTNNDPNERYYFDAYGAIVEEVTSTSKNTIKLSSPASKILSVNISKTDNIDYFVGGKIEIDSVNAIQEFLPASSLPIPSIKLNYNILQIIKVEVLNDFSKKDYFEGGSILKDGKTIILGTIIPPQSEIVITYTSSDNKNKKINTQVVRLNRELPSKNTKVYVKYIPQGLDGNRVSIYKDIDGNINYSIIGSNNTFTIRQPISWSKNTWHRIKASFKVNKGLGRDEMSLFIDGYEYKNIINKDNILIKDQNKLFIKFKDCINNLFFGNSFDESKQSVIIIDNLRLSNIFREIKKPYGYGIDLNYNSNLNAAIPVTKDLYTTYLLNFNESNIINIDNFATITNKNNGNFDFYVDVLDNFKYINNDEKIKLILEKLINLFKPANTRAFIKYI